MTMTPGRRPNGQKIMIALPPPPNVSNIFVGFEGGVGALYGGVCMAMHKMTEIVEVNQSDFDATVRAGVTRHQLNDWIRADGLHFPIDPGKW